MWVWLVSVLGCTGAGGSIAATPEPAPSTTVVFDGRTVDLAAHLEGFPYEAVAVVPEAGLVLVEHDGDTGRLLAASFDPTHPPDLAAARAVSDVDWNARTRWDVRHHAASGRLFYAGDERNDEKIDLWSMSIADGSLQRLTDVPYLYGWSFDPTETTIAYLGRRPSPADPNGFVTCLETMRPDGTDKRSIVCDTPEATFTWSDPAWAPDGRGVVARVNVGGRRDRGNLAWIALDRPELRLIEDPASVRLDTQPVLDWVDDDRFVYTSDETGSDQLYLYDVERGAVSQLTTLDREITGAELLDQGGRKRLLVVLHRADGDALLVVDPLTGVELDREPVAGTAWIAGDDRSGLAWIARTSSGTPFAVDRVTVGADGGLTVEPWLAVPPDTAERLVRCDVERVEFPTFDADSTGATRVLHGFLYTPNDPPPIERRLVRVLAFYGGVDAWEQDTQIFCDAGIATFSPLVRGSPGISGTFSRLNDGDLGGDEIVDLFFAARWLESQGYARGHVGVYGRSHGGYATMRALTFPPGTNGHDEVYPFGFGLSDAGFADILTFHEAANIPDWVITEAGDPVTEAEKLRDRSPLSHVDQLRAPLFLSHGEMDSRVPVTESRRMAAACEAAGKPCTYVEFPGQGHKVRGLGNEVRLYNERFRFLEDVLAGDGAAFELLPLDAPDDPRGDAIEAAIDDAYGCIPPSVEAHEVEIVLDWASDGRLGHASLRTATPVADPVVDACLTDAFSAVPGSRDGRPMRTIITW